MSSVVIAGDTSGSITLQAPATAGSTVLTLPTTTGTLATTASTAASATNLAGGSAGVVPYQSGSGATSFTSVGTSGQLLQSNGSSAPSWATVSSGMSLVSTINGSGSSQVAWSGLSGSVNYLVVLGGLAQTPYARDIRLQIGTGGTYITSGYSYSGVVYGSGGVTGFGGSGGGLLIAYAGSYYVYFNGWILITQPPDYSYANFTCQTNDQNNAISENVGGLVATSAIISNIKVYAPGVNYNFGSASLYKLAS